MENRKVLHCGEKTYVESPIISASVSIFCQSLCTKYLLNSFFFLFFFLCRMEIIPKPWKKTFLQAQKTMRTQLHSINPSMLAVLDLWQVSYK